MRRSACITQPHVATAGMTSTWSFTYISTTSLAKGSKIRFDLRNQGREIDWQHPVVDLNQSQNVIYAHLSGGEIVIAQEVPSTEGTCPAFEFTLPTDLEEEEPFVIMIGKGTKTSTKETSSGNRCQKYTQRRRLFYLYTMPKQKKQFGPPEVFHMDVKGGKLSKVRILAPSYTSKNKRFDVLVRFEDQFGNLISPDSDDDTLIQISHERLRKNLNWKIFVPEAGFISLPNVYFNEPGIYQIQLKNLSTEALFFSSPIKCFLEENKAVLWGILHGESLIFTDREHENYLRYFRDYVGCDFFISSLFEEDEKEFNQVWKNCSQHVSDFHEEGRFLAFLGFQWMGQKQQEGLRQMIYKKDPRPMLRRKEVKEKSLKQIYKGAAEGDLLSIPVMTMCEEVSYNFKDFSPLFECVVEIYNCWGCSIGTEEEGNPFPFMIEKTKKTVLKAEGSIINALKQNKRFGFVAGGLDTRGIYKTLQKKGYKQYSPGFTAILAKNSTKEALFEALFARRCYVTTGERIFVDFSVAGKEMGSEMNTLEKPGLALNRHISGEIAGTASIKQISLFRNGEVIKVFKPQEMRFSFSHDDTDPIEKVALTSKEEKQPFLFYFLQVVQEDQHVAWSSPIWIDVLLKSKKKEKGKIAS